jgi:phosphatidylserine decarboxylase
MENVPDVTPEIPTPTWRLLLTMLGRLPQRALSRGFGRVADLPIPRAARATLHSSFARAVGIDLTEVELPLEEYPTLNAFFVRRLRSGVRDWPDEVDAIASPVDGILGSFGRIVRGRAVQAKGHDYLLSDLLVDEAEAEAFDDGSYLTIYLSPRHYHRIHAPAPGTVERAAHVRGSLLPVNAPAVMHVPGLFARNERLICYLNGHAGRIAVVAVGAYNVGRISAAFDPEWSGSGRDAWVRNHRSSPTSRRDYDPPVTIPSGGEIMAFHLGSTVVMLLQPGVELLSSLVPGAEVRLGATVARGRSATAAG